MIKRFGNNIFRKRLNSIINHKNISQQYLILHTQPTSTLKFSIINNKQFNNNLLFNEVTKEELQNYVQDLNMISSTRYDNIEILIENERIQNPTQALPKDLLIQLMDGIKHYSMFYSLIYTIIKHNEEHQVIENIEHVKNLQISKLLRWSKLNALYLKSIYQEWFNFNDLKSLTPEFNIGIKIDQEGKDLVTYDQVTYYYAFTELSLGDFVNSTFEPTRELLIALISMGCFKAPISGQQDQLFKYITKFVEIYPIVKERYTNINTINNNTTDGNNLKVKESSWTHCLGKVYTEDEFDWFIDLETDLPMHLGGFYNICKECIHLSSKPKTPDNIQQFLQLLNSESLRTPNNPYIPLIKLFITNDYSIADECLKIMKYSNSQSRFEKLKRIESFGIFTNEKPSQPRIKDLKYFPLLLIKAKTNPHMLEQVEYYSRLPTHTHLIFAKFEINLQNGKLEEALQNYQCLSYFEHTIHPDMIYHITNLAAKAMITLGFNNECIEVIEMFNQKYGPDEKWKNLLQLARNEIEKRK